MTYAKNTKVSPLKTRNEIETLLSKRGAKSFGFASGLREAGIQCEVSDRRMLFRVALFHGPNRVSDQEERRRWRALLLVIKAKFESVESGIETVDSAFMANIVNPGTGKTIGDEFTPQIKAAYASGKAMPPLLGMGS